MEILPDVIIANALPQEGEGLYSSDVSKRDGIEERLGDFAKRLQALERPGQPEVAGDRKLESSQRWFKPQSLLAVIPLALILAGAWWVFDRRVDERIDLKLAEPNRRLGEIEQRIARIEGKLDVLGSTVLGDKIKSGVDALASNPASGAAQIQRVLAQADEEKIRVDPKALTESADEALKIAFHGTTGATEAAWRAALDMAQYRSVLNVTDAPVDKGPAFLKYYVQIDDEHTNVATPTYYGKIVPINDAAMSLKIGQTANEASGPEQVVFTGPGIVHLDGYHMRNIVFRNLQIRYTGGPVILENVALLNCTFDIPRSEKGRLLVAKLIASPRASVSIGVEPTVGLLNRRAADRPIPKPAL